MNGHRKPRRPRWVKSINTLDIALHRATKFTPAEIAKRMEPLREAITMLRCGMANEQHWQCLASAVTVSLSIEKKGVVRGLIEHLTTADHTLAAIKARCTAQGGWKPTALYFYEIEAMATAVSLFAFQLGELSAQEYDQAFQHARAENARVGGIAVQATAATSSTHAPSSA
jgi:hypothetical protein